MNINLPEKVKFIIDTITAAGFEAFAVGGCIRDSILGRDPADWDITTSAKPEQVKSLFAKTFDTGIQHGTITVLIDKEGFEVTTYRIDGEYEDSRHPKEVIFTSNLVEDLKRRDFTINAMAYNETTGLVDEFGGMEDIDNCVIRCVGNPRERFSEDALRIMRAVRFSAQLGYEIEENTKQAIIELADTLCNISAERIQVELVKLLCSPHPDYLKIMYDTGVTRVVLPEFDRMMETPQVHPHHMYDVGTHTLVALKETPGDRVLRLAVLFHDMGKPETMEVDEDGITHFHGHQVVSRDIARQVLKRLRFDNDTIYKVTKLVEFHDYGNGVEPTKTIVRRAVHRIGEDIFPMLYAVRRADVLAQSEYQREEKLGFLEDWQKLYEEIVADAECVSLKTLAVTGTDLIAEGVKPGKEIGEILQALLQYVLDNPDRNQKDILITYFKENLHNYSVPS
ncbi:MAG: HD domain-containing protein [Lachnospiraceae bacterium]|nr:HD domain-containing protein [Lachnospiraceae bacterium]